MKKTKRKIYMMQCNNFIKIGLSKTPEERMKTFQTGNPYKIILLLQIEYDDCYYIESNLHRYLEKNRITGEWFSVDEDVKKLVKYLKNVEYNRS